MAVLQGNVAQEQKWDPAKREAITDRYVDDDPPGARAGRHVHHVAGIRRTRCLSSRTSSAAAAIRRLAVESRATLLIGSDQVEPIRVVAPPTQQQSRYYNAAFLVGPDGTTGAVYRKMHLVPFGEYVPLQSLLFFVGPIVERRRILDFTPGHRSGAAAGGRHTASTAICYEVIYPNLMRQFVRDGSELLTTITNDAWYGPIVGRLPALGAGVDARDRGGPVSRARGQHRDQRLRRSVRTRHRRRPICSSPQSSCRTCDS